MTVSQKHNERVPIEILGCLVGKNFYYFHVTAFTGAQHIRGA
jgi:hypothetical protein